MSKIIKFPSHSAPADQPTEPPQIDTQTQSFQDKCFAAYRNRGRSRGLQADYLNDCLWSVQQLLTWARKTLTTITAPDYEAWTTHLADEKNLKPNSQRNYQKGVRQFFKYITRRQDLQNEAAKLFGQRIELVAHEDNSIVHTVSDETAGDRPPLSHDEIEQFFQAIDREIDLAELERPRALRGLKRDYAVIYTGYIYGLRVSELSSLNPADWRPCAEVPELGRYGQLHIRFGKGAKGSGKRHRIVPTTHVGYPEFLTWYLTEVRPLYKPGARDDEPLFFNERGGRLSKASIEKSMKRLIICAGLDATKYSPHTLRRSMCQHELMRAPSELARAKAGHHDTATTLIYGQVPAEHYRKHQQRLVRTQLNDIRSRKKRD